MNPLLEVTVFVA